jgi:hypothetical protein
VDFSLKIQARKLEISRYSKREFYRQDEIELERIKGELSALEWSLKRVHEYSLEDSQLFQVK